MGSDTVETPNGRGWTCAAASPCLWKALLESPSIDATDPPVWQDESSAASKDGIKYAVDQIYKPIHEWQTRLIRLHPAKMFGDDLRCDLVTASFIIGRGFGTQEFGRVEFDALSYSWGYPDFTCSILCNGVSLPITLALSTALRFLRKEVPRMLWIDAFCINQLDAAEKSRQVESMLLIFQRAERVIAWLGNSTLTDEVFLEALKLAGASSENHAQQRSLCPFHLPMLKKLHVQFMQRPFFSRTWIRQEVWQARNMSIHCGSLMCEYTFLMENGATLRKYYDAAITNTLANGEFDSSDSLWSLTSRLKAKGEPLVRYLEPFVDAALFKASDDRDRIYGVIGMLEGCRAQHGGNEPDQPMLEIDYSEHVDRLYLRFVTHYVRRFKSIHILRLINRLAKPRRKNALPWWAIDFRQELVYIRDRAWYANDNISPRPNLRPLQHNAGSPTGEETYKLENIRSDDDRRIDDAADNQHVDLGDFISLVVEGSRVGEVHRLLSDSEAVDHLQSLSPSETDVSQLVLEKTLCLAEVTIKLEINTLYENRESRRKRLMSPLIPLSGERTEVRRAVVALPVRAREGDLMVRISSSGLFVIREWSKVQRPGQESSTGRVQQVPQGVEAQQKGLLSLSLLTPRPGGKQSTKSGPLTSNEQVYAFIGPVWLESGEVLVANGVKMNTQEFVLR